MTDQPVDYEDLTTMQLDAEAARRSRRARW